MKHAATLLLHKMNRVELAELYYSVCSAIEMRERDSSRGIYFPLSTQSVILRTVKVDEECYPAEESP